MSGAVGELHLVGIPVETGVVDVAHVAELAEHGSARADFGGRNRLLAGNRALDKVKNLVFALVKLDGSLVEGIDTLDVGDGSLEPGVLLDGRGRTVIGAGVARFENASLESAELVDRLADIGSRLYRRTFPDGDFSSVHRDDTLRSVENGTPDAERPVIKLDIAVRLFKEHFHPVLTATAVIKVCRMGFLGTDDAIRAGVVHIKPPLRDVEMVSAPIAVVSETCFIVEAPEHRIPAMNAGNLRVLVISRRKPVGIGSIFRRTEPHIPINIGIRTAFFGGLLWILEEPERMRRSAEFLSGDTVVGVDIKNIADKSVSYDHGGCPENIPAALHGTALEDAAVLFLGRDDLARFVNVIGERLLAIDILSAFHRFDSDVRMPMIGRRDDDEINRRIRDYLAEIGAVAARGLLYRIFGVLPVDMRSASFRAHLVAIAHEGHAAEIGHVVA